MIKSVCGVFASLCAIVYANNAMADTENKTNLNCTSQLTVFDKQYGENKYEEKFDVVIYEDKDGVSVTSSTSTVGASISFGKRSFARHRNIKNMSNESKLHYVYDEVQPNGDIFASHEFNINRYTGSIYVSMKSKFVAGNSVGTCKAYTKKMF